MATTMNAGTGAAPGQAPPDLPSLLLDGRICYIGMPVRTRRTAGQQQFLFMTQPCPLLSIISTHAGLGNLRC